MKELLIGLLIFGSISVYANDIIVENGESVNVVVDSCDTDQYTKLSVKNNTTVTATCEAKICITGANKSSRWSGYALGRVSYGIYIQAGQKLTHIKDYVGKGSGLDQEIQQLRDDKKCKLVRFSEGSNLLVGN